MGCGYPWWMGGWMHPAGLTGAGYQALRRSTHQAYQWSVAWLGVLAVRRWVTVGPAGMLWGAVVQCEWDDNRVELERVPGPDGQTTYGARLSGEFVIEVTPRDEYEKRLMILELRQLRTPGREASAWGLVRQEALAHVFGVTQEEIRRWQRYVREGQWAQLLSLQEKSLLTDDLRQQIVEVWADNFPSGGALGAAGWGGDRTAGATSGASEWIDEDSGASERTIHPRGRGAASARWLCDRAIVQVSGSIAGPGAVGASRSWRRDGRGNRFAPTHGRRRWVQRGT